MKALVAAVVAAGFLLTGCSSSSKSSTSSSKYQQTWSKSYASTTCADWSGAMTDQQKWVAAADMLSGARSKDGAKGLPADSLVSTFQSAISTSCIEKTMAITDAAVGVYLTERQRFGP